MLPKIFLSQKTKTEILPEGNNEHGHWALKRAPKIYRIGLLLLFVIFCGCDTESAKWDHAKAKNLYSQGDLKGAIECLESAHQKSPQDNGIKLELAERYAESGQCELGIGLCNEYLKEHPNDVAGYGIRAGCWRFLGKFDEALADHKRSLSDHVSRDPGELNDLAYYRGLADKEINKATLDIQTAIERIELGARGAGTRVSMQVRVLVAAGLISRHIDQHAEAIEKLDKMILVFTSKASLTNEVLKTRVTGSLRYQDKLSKSEEEDIKKTRLSLQRQKESLTALLATRALIFEDLGEQDKADQDRLAIHELDFDFEEIVKRFPSDLNCLLVMQNTAMFLDTRGFVLGRQQWATDQQLVALMGAPARDQLLFSNYREALSDLDLAVMAVDFEQLALESPLLNTTNLPAEAIEGWKKANKKNRAILRHHRKEIHLRGGNEAAAALDQKSIDELGFNDSSLF